MAKGFFSIACLLSLTTVAYGLNCTYGDRSSCSERGYCTYDGLCQCDDYLHYWPSEYCSTWHDGRELSSGMYCYPNTVDQYCSWMGVCSPDGSTCECFDSQHRISEDRCFNWYPSSSDTPPPSGPPSIQDSTCSPYERSYCSDRGYCNSEGSGCVCDDYLHYWPSEKCSTWHNGRELEAGLCCYPNTVDQYCSWMGVCNSEGNSCDCFDSEHRTYVDRCFNWYSDVSAVTFAPTPAPVLSPLSLSPSVGNQSCLYVTLIDNFGDGWDSDVAFVYETINQTFGSLNLAKGPNGYKLEGCLPKYSYSHPIRLSIFSAFNSKYLWEVQWSSQILSPSGNSEIFYGGFDTIFEFYYSNFTDTYILESWDGLWVYPEQSEACANLPGPSGCSDFQFIYTPVSSATPESNHTGGNYHEASWVITNSTFLDIFDFGIPWGDAIIENGTDSTCNTCLADGEYVLRISGANYESANDILWTFCGVSGGAMSQLTFVILDGICTPRLPILTLTTLLFNDICPAMPTYPTSPPTNTPPTLYPSWNNPTSPAPTYVTPPSPSSSPSQPPVTTPTSSPAPTFHVSSTPAPTFHVSSTPAPTHDFNDVPVVVNVTVGDDDSTSTDCIVLDVEVTVTNLGGTVYCANFPSSYSLVDVWTVIHQNHWVAAPEASDFPPGTLISTVNVSICSLDPYKEYTFYCVVTDSWGNPTTSVDDATGNSVSVFTSFPIGSTLYSSPSGYALNVLSDYDSLSSSELSLFTVSFELEHAPSDTVYVSLAFFEKDTDIRRYDLHFSPSSYLVARSSVGASLKGSFLIFGPPGTYNMRLEFTGPSAYLFLVSNTAEITIISGGASSLPPLMPMISSAFFDFSGARVIVSFDVPTDFAATVVNSNIWKCDKIFSFSGVAQASCVWINSMTVAITLNYYGRAVSLVSPGQNITLLNGVLKGAGSTSTFTPSSTAPLSVASTHALPAAVLIAPTKITNCQDLVLDPSSSVGQGSRNWKTIQWKVKASDGGDVSALLSFLSVVTSTALPIVIPSSLLRSTTYSFSLGLRNFLQDSTEALVFTTVKVDVVADGPIVSLSLSSPSVINVERSSVLILDAHADLSYCQDAFSLASGSPVATYSWTVKKNNVVDGTIVSTSPNPASFMASGSNFDLQSVYEVSVDVTIADWTSTWSASKSTIVFGVESTVSALISGGMSALSIHPSETLVVDADSSVGTNLVYDWSCRIASSDNYGADFFALAGYIPSGNTLTFPPSTFSVGTTYVLSLVVTSTSVIGSVSDSASLTIFVPSTIADVSIEFLDPVPDSPFNVQHNLRVFANLQSSSSLGVSCIWSVSGSAPLDLTAPDTTLTPLNHDFTQSQLTGGIQFPLGIHFGALAPGNTYTFRLTASQIGASDRFMEIAVRCNSPPFGGDISVSPSSGVAYTTLFTLSGPYWVSQPENYPLLYRFVYQIAEVFDWSDTYGIVNSLQRSPFASARLPAGVASSNTLVVAVIVVDIWNAESHTSQSITVSPSTRRQLTAVSFDSLMNTFTMAKDMSKLDSMISSFQLALDLVNDPLRVDCSLAPLCKDLNRGDCSAQSQTCGSCLEGFVGVFGSSNSACHSADEARLSIGEVCTKNDDCYFEYCGSDNLCSLPLQSCSIGSNGEICSGHGVCSFLNLQGDLMSSGECTVDNANCLPTCVCDTGFGGGDCSLDTAEVSSMKLNRGALCDSLDVLTGYLSSADDRLKTQVNYLQDIFDPFSLTPDQCESAIKTLSSYVQSANPTLSVHSGVADVISSFADSPETLSLVSVFQDSVFGDMVSGQTPLQFSTLNYRVSFTYEPLSALSGGVVLAAPLIDVEILYHKSPTNITLPESGLSMCSQFDNYAKLVLTVWGQSPYDISNPILKENIFTLTTFSTGSNSATTPVGDSDHYSLNLYLSEDINIELYEPVCLQYDVNSGLLSSCAHCSVFSYSPSLAQISCTDVSSYFCPSSTVGTTSFIPKPSGADISPKIYSLGVTSLPDPYGATTSQDNMSTGVLSFMSVYLFSVLVGAALLFWWDRTDRNNFILSANLESSQRQNTTFILSAAFDDSGRKSDVGVKFSQIAAYSARGTSLSHDRAYSREKKSLFALNNPLNRTSTAVDRNGQPIPEISVQSTPRTTTMSESYGSSSVVELDALSDRQSQSNPSVVQVPADLQGDAPILTWSDLPVSSLLSEHSWLTRLLYTLGRHHKWARIFTYPSMRKTRLIRFIVAASDLLFIIFANTIFYMIFYPDDGLCQSRANTSMENCLARDSRFESDVSLCQWHNDGSCTLREPPFNLNFIIQVCMIVIVFSSIPRSIFQYLLEKICAKRPIIEDFGLSSSTLLADEPVPVNAGYKLRNQNGGRNDIIGRVSMDIDVVTDLYALTHCDHMSVQEEAEVVLAEKPIMDDGNHPFNIDQLREIQRDLLHVNEDGSFKKLSWRQWFLFQTGLSHLQWKLRRARNEAGVLIRTVVEGSEAGPDQTDYADMCLLQHFILEQVSPITRYALKKDIFEMDHATPGRIGFLPWISAWCGVIGVWVFMASWVIAWSVNNGAGPARAWGLVLGIVIIADMITNELSQIYFLHVHMAQKLRPQLRDIFGVLSDILEFRVQHKSARYGGLRVSQHFSPSCRSARSQSLSAYLSSHMLSLVDDIDIAVCRQSRLLSLRDVGLFSWMTLFHPSLLNTAHDMFQQTAMDLIVPIAWCCFILLNHAIVQFSVYLLIGLYIGGFLFMLWFYYFVNATEHTFSKPYTQLTISGRRSQSPKDSPELEMTQNTPPFNNKTHYSQPPQQQQHEEGGGVVLGSEMEINYGHPTYLALPVSEAPTNPEDVELYFSSDIFAGQQQMISGNNENEYTL
jgi:hypothetical protein